jgi:hypothetical protein
MFFLAYFLLLIGLCQSQTNYPMVQRGMPLQGSTPWTSSMFQANTKLGAQFSITHALAVQVCIHRFPLQYVSSIYWNVSCNWYYTYPASPPAASKVPITNQVCTLLLHSPLF